MRYLRRDRLLGPSRGPWAWTRMSIGAAILAVLIWRLGTGPFLEPLRQLDAWSLVAAVGIAVPTTVCCAWRWQLVSRGLGSGLPLGAAIGAYYQSQFLNTVLPGGVLGDVRRGMRRGHEVGDLGRGLRVVAWERTAGQVVQIALTMVVLLVLPSPIRSSMPVIAMAVVVAALAAVVVARTLPRRGPSVLARTARALATDVRDGLLASRVWPGVVLASAVVVAGHATTFLVAARAAGLTVSPTRLLPLILLVLLVTALPTNFAGWGPREGGAAWVFPLAGLGADQGVATAVTYGVMVFVATLPGAAVMVVAWLRRRPDSHRRLPAPATAAAAQESLARA
jgi:glycosyltransferase 2 family protein